MSKKFCTLPALLKNIKKSPNLFLFLFLFLCWIHFNSLDEGEKVALVLAKFPSLPVSQAQDGALQKLVGRVVIAGQTGFYAPVDNMPCVYYWASVEEEERHWRETRDQNGNVNGGHWEYRWVTVVQEEKYCDFYLQDGTAKVFVQGSSPGQCKRQGTGATRTNEFTIPIFHDAITNAVAGFFNALAGNVSPRYANLPPPAPGVWDMITRNKGYGWKGNSHSTGKFRAQQVSYDVNELVACLGVVGPATDHYGFVCKRLNPINGQALTDKYCQENKWDSWDRQAWQDLVVNSPSVLTSDNVQFTAGVNVQPVMNLPVFMTHVVLQPCSIQMLQSQTPVMQMVQQQPQQQTMVMQPQPVVMQQPQYVQQQPQPQYVQQQQQPQYVQQQQQPQYVQQQQQPQYQQQPMMVQQQQPQYQQQPMMVQQQQPQYQQQPVMYQQQPQFR
jgi:hypothetical protein